VTKFCQARHIGHRMLPGIAVALCALIFISSANAQKRVPVDLELILMADGSGSVDDDEFIIQRQGYAKALRHPDIWHGISSGILRRIALSYVEWSGPELQIPIIKWTLIEKKSDLDAFAKKLETLPRELYSGGTAIGNAILYGANSIKSNRFDGTREVVDLSGDGWDRNGMPAAEGRDQAVKMGITVNGLPVLDEDRIGLDKFFVSDVIGGRGAFSIPANGFKDVFFAIRRKLILEISGKPVPLNGAAQLPL
tara:strand:- start:49176 stop:49931 length:756 start_codon:yes stop_codon:yes gene_type:complete